ncbi:MAG: GGDEF and EAL domain-containing protein [Hyphomicrobiaceae bacterium]
MSGPSKAGPSGTVLAEAIRAASRTHREPAPLRRLETPPTTSQAPPPLRFDIEATFSAAGAVAFAWDMRSDRMAWQQGAAKALHFDGRQGIDTGAAYHLNIAASHAGRRYDTIRTAALGDRGEGSPYRLEYPVLPEGRRSHQILWVEEKGRAFAAKDGQPLVARGFIHPIDDRRREEERLRYLSDHDEQTGLPNLSRLTVAIEDALAQHTVANRPFVFLMVAIKNLGLVNETFGFETGNELIRAVAHRLAAEVRGGDVIGRFAANKFGVVVHGCDADGLQAAAKRLSNAIRSKPIETPACRIASTVSIGAVQVPEHALVVGDIFGFALDALDESKTGREDRLVIYTPNARRASRRRRNIEMADAIIAALDEQRMRIALQPIVAAGSGEVSFYECLLRMQRIDGEVVSAGEFIPVAEQLGLSRLIDHRVLELSVGLLRQQPELKLSFNVSGLTAGDHDWLVALDRLIAGDRALASRLIVEITETAAIQDINESVAFVDTVKELGCRVAIDDFGAGYTSFHNLKHLGADMVKIDGTFIKNLATDPADKVFVEALVHLARSFKMETVAEWVGDQASVDILTGIGVDFLQGFHFGQPKLALYDASGSPKIVNARA